MEGLAERGSSYYGGGGTQTQGGSTGASDSAARSPADKYFGAWGTELYGGGGGDGWYGGGAGGWTGGDVAGGGGGSGFVGACISGTATQVQGGRGAGTSSLGHPGDSDTVAQNVPLPNGAGNGGQPTQGTALTGQAAGFGGDGFVHIVPSPSGTADAADVCETDAACEAADPALPVCNAGACVGPGLQADTSFSYTGQRNVYTVPADSTELEVFLWGAGGGGNILGVGRSWGGAGGYTRCTISVTPGEQLHVFVGGRGEQYSGGWPNGGAAPDPWKEHYTADGWNGGAGGGGRSEIRRYHAGGSETDSEGKFDSIAVAGGGGGGGFNNRAGVLTNNYGGGGGGASGTAGYSDGSVYHGTGGTQVNGGNPGTIIDGHPLRGSGSSAAKYFGAGSYAEFFGGGG
eukprot:2016213-Rhodomonas_salina.1